MAETFRSIPSSIFARAALTGALLLALFTIGLVLARNSVEGATLHRAALDPYILKNRWPQFKNAMSALHAPVIATLARAGPLEISSPIPEKMREITEAHSSTLDDGGIVSGRLVAHIEIILFERDAVQPSTWLWVPEINTGLTATALRTRVSLQQLQQTQLLTADGQISEPVDSMIHANQRRALIFFYLHTEWEQHETIIKILIRASQIIAFLTVVAIALWVLAVTGRPGYCLLIVFTALVALVIYSSLTLKALSLRTVLTMLITLQFGPGANRAGDYASLSVLLGAAYGLMMTALLRRPANQGCTGCGRAVSDEFRYCPHCNRALKHNCARCAAAVDMEWNYCPNCSEEI